MLLLIRVLVFDSNTFQLIMLHLHHQSVITLGFCAIPSGLFSKCFLITKTVLEQWSLNIKAHWKRRKYSAEVSRGGPFISYQLCSCVYSSMSSLSALTGETWVAVRND